MLIFVYGTLKSDESNFNILKKCIPYELRFLGPKKVNTLSKYTLEQGYMFPSLYNTPGIGEIIDGELWEIKDKKISSLDEYEGVSDNLFERGFIDVRDENDIIYTNVLVYFRVKG